MNDTTMLAAVFERPGDAQQVLQLREMPLPAPGPGEVLVRMQAASIHPADHMFIAGAYRHAPVFPQRAGMVGTGVVVQAGDTRGWVPGTRVAFRHPNAWAQYCAVPATRLFAVPPAVEVAAAAQFALNPVTAWCLIETSAARAGDWLAVNAPRSNVAALVRDLATARGLHVADIERGPADAAARRLLAATGGEPVTALLDAVGGPGLVGLLPALRPGASIVSYGLLDDATVPVRSADLIQRNLRWIGFGVDHWLARLEEQREAMSSELWAAIASGAVRLPVRASFALDALDAALEADAAGGEGKVVLTMGNGA